MTEEQGRIEMDSYHKCEFWTNGDEIKIGNDIDNGKCLKFRFGEYDKIQDAFSVLANKGDDSTVISLQGSRYKSDTEYLIHARSPDCYYIFKNGTLVLITGKKMKEINFVVNKARNILKEIDLEKVVEIYLESKVESEYVIECVNCSTSFSRVELVETYPPVDISLKRLQKIKDIDFVNDVSIHLCNSSSRVSYEPKGDYDHEDEIEFCISARVNTRMLISEGLEAESIYDVEQEDVEDFFNNI